MKENKKGGWISHTDIFDKAIIGPYTTLYKNFHAISFEYTWTRIYAHLLYLTGGSNVSFLLDFVSYEVHKKGCCLHVRHKSRGHGYSPQAS